VKAVVDGAAVTADRERERASLGRVLAKADQEAAALEAAGDRAGAGAVRWGVMLERQRAQLLDLLLAADTAPALEASWQ